MSKQESDGSSREERFLSLFLPQEIDAAESMIKDHKDLIIDMPRNVLTLFNESLNSPLKKTSKEISSSEWVCRLILGRLMQDIRSMSVCASLSYATGVASIAAGIFEIALEVIYLANDDEAAENWLGHGIIKKTSSDMDQRIGNYVEKLGYVGKEKEEWKKSILSHIDSFVWQNMEIRCYNRTSA